MAADGVEVTDHFSGTAPQGKAENDWQILEIEDLITEAIRKIQVAGKRADFESVPAHIEKQHGLAKTVTFQNLESMIANNKISSINYRGKPSLRIPKFSEHSGKERKISNDEERLSECREELQEMASRHCSSSMENPNEGNVGANSSSASESSSYEGEDENEDASMLGDSCKLRQSIHGQSDVFPNDRVGEIFDDEGEQRCQDLWGDERAVDYRLAMLERKLDDLTLRVNSGQPATTAIDEVKNRVVVLENEKMKLLDENTALKIENAELKGFIRGKVDTIENDVKNLYQENSNKNNEKGKGPGNEFIKVNYREKTKQEVNIRDGAAIRSPKVKDTTSMEREKSYPDSNQDNGISVKFRPRAQRELDCQGWSFTKKKRFENFFETTATKPVTSSIEPIETRNRFSALQNIEEDMEVKDKTVVHGECKCAQTKERKSITMTMHEFPPQSQVNSQEQQAENNIGERKRNVVPGEYTYAYVTERKAIDTKENEIPLASPGQNSKQGRAAASAATNRSRANPRLKDGTRFRKQSISIVGDSMVSKVRRQDLTREVPKYRINVKTFRGARVEHMYSYMEPTIEMGVDGVIILCGTNNLRDESPEVVAKKIVNLAMHASNRVEQVAVSSIVRRTDSIELDQKRKEVNVLLKQLLDQCKIDYIDQDNISTNDLDRWGLHLNYNGNNILTGNFIDFLNNT